MKLLLNVVVLAVLLASTASYAEEIAIIANEKYPADSVSVTTLRDIYLGEKNTEGGIRIKPYIQKDPAIRKIFLDRVLGLTEDKYNAYWIKKVFQEGGIPPMTKPSSEEVIGIVRDDDGAVGYIWKDEGNVSGIKILLTIEVGD